jgi:hypothetical protein
VAPPNRPRAGEQIQRAEWVAEAVRLAVKGLSVRKIGLLVGKSHTAVCEALREQFEARQPDPKEVELARAMKRERLHRQLDAWVPRSLNMKPQVVIDGFGQKVIIRAPDKDAAMVVAKFEELLARLEGTDAPKRTELSGPGGGPVPIRNYSALTDEQLARLAAGEPLEDEPGAAPEGAPGGEGEGGTGAAAPPSSPGDGGMEG